MVRRVACGALVVGGLLVAAAPRSADPGVVGGLHPACKAGMGLAALGLGHHLPDLVWTGAGLMWRYC